MATHLLYFVAAGLFTLAAVLQFISGNTFAGAVSLLAAVTFTLSGIHWLRKKRAGKK